MLPLREYLRIAAKKLEHGLHPDQASQDAEFLIRYALGKDRAWMMANWPLEISAEEVRGCGLLIDRRYAGEPIQYITGETEFYGLPFSVAPGVLIPRPETEHLVEKVLQLAAEFRQTNLRIADIGTGSGAIAIALAHSLPEARIFATDLSPEALAIAMKNARRNRVAECITFLEGDLLAPLAGEEFQIIASNPPYVPLADCDSLSVEVRDFEPHSALFAGDDGLEIYRRLIPCARELLVSGGWLVLEIGYGQRAAIASLLDPAGFREVDFVPDYQGIARVAVARR